MIDMTTELGEKAMVLVPLVAVLVNELKRSAWIVKLQEKFPVFTIAAMALGIGGALLQGIVNPVMAGILVGLLASGAYSAVKVNNGVVKP